ncbi:hypothetical protein OL548_11075 [Lysinibacillus sp. MHQ-1]|nr:hypothetical protein OL548_11075 [Lysinibacillus sp. MHQ-1]
MDILKVAISSELSEELQQMVFPIGDGHYMIYWTQEKKSFRTINQYSAFTGDISTLMKVVTQHVRLVTIFFICRYVLFGKKIV